MANSTSWSPSVEEPTQASTLLIAFHRITRLGSILLAVLLAAQTTRSVWDGVYTSAQAERGAALYANNCASCHGSALGGGESAPPLTGGEFSSNWYGLTVGDLFERIRITMPA